MKSHRRTTRKKFSAAEMQKRIDLAAAYRLVHLYGMDEMIANHISARVPGKEGVFYINPYGLLYDQMHASCFVELDLDGNVRLQPDRATASTRPASCSTARCTRRATTSTA